MNAHSEAPGRGVRALTFDVFGTVVDWRSGVIRDARALGQRLGFEADWGRLADAWRGRYQPSMARVRSGERPWTRLDDLHRENLLSVLEEMGLPAPGSGLGDEAFEWLVRCWHRLDPWPDVLPGLARLRRGYVLATLSNANVALLVDMARRSGLPWDAVLGAEVVRHYKPDPEAYLGTAELLGLEPWECMMVAAHESDLLAAKAMGMRTAFVPRPLEHGPGGSAAPPDPDAHDVVAGDFIALASALGC